MRHESDTEIMKCIQSLDGIVLKHLFFHTIEKKLQICFHCFHSHCNQLTISLLSSGIKVETKWNQKFVSTFNL